jgi:hypothetical protein
MLALSGPNAEAIIRNTKRLLEAMGELDLKWNRFVQAWDQGKPLDIVLEKLQQKAAEVSWNADNWRDFGPRE